MTTTTKTTTLTNSFHGSEVRTRLDLEQVQLVLDTAHAASPELAKAQRQARRLKKQLCGIKGCTCGDTFGRRG